MYEIFIKNFTNDPELTPIDIVQDITGLSYEEIMKSDSFVKIHIDEKQHFDNKMEKDMRHISKGLWI